MTGSLPQDAAARKAAPMAEGLLWYFPNALAAVAAVSKAGNDQHNPGEPMHHARGKSMDHADCIIRHLVDAGTIDTDGQRHTAKVAWRALALLQEEIEREEGCPLPRNAVADPASYSPPFEGNPDDCALPPNLAATCRPVMAAEADRIADAAPLYFVPDARHVENAYAMGWRRSALWAKRDDLIADIDSLAFYADRAKDLFGVSPDDRL